MSSLLKIAQAAFEKRAASMQAVNNKLYGQFVKRTFGGWDKVRAAKAAGGSLDLVHGTDPSNVKSIMQRGLSDSSGVYGPGAYFGDDKMADFFGRAKVQLIGPREATQKGLSFKSLGDVKKVDAWTPDGIISSLSHKFDKKHAPRLQAKGVERSEIGYRKSRFSSLLERRKSQFPDLASKKRYEATGIHPELGNVMDWQASNHEIHVDGSVKPEFLKVKTMNEQNRLNRLRSDKE